MSLRSARLRMQIVAFPAQRRSEFMPTEEVQQTEVQRYVYYTLAAVIVAAVLAFIYLFNFTSFFKLAVPL